MERASVRAELRARAASLRYSKVAATGLAPSTRGAIADIAGAVDVRALVAEIVGHPRHDPCDRGGRGHGRLGPIALRIRGGRRCDIGQRGTPARQRLPALWPTKVGGSAS